MGRIAGASVLAALGVVALVTLALTPGCSSSSAADALGGGDAAGDATFGGSSSGGDDAAVGPARDANGRVDASWRSGA
ncbi:MAG TPA: hypothetical protein VII82_02615, partial [Polyangiaceae bacterium]